MNNFYIKAGMKIAFLRSQKGYTRVQLAEMALISNKFLYEIETGKKGFSAEVLFRLCRALNVSSDLILFKEYNELSGWYENEY